MGVGIDQTGDQDGVLEQGLCILNTFEGDAPVDDEDLSAGTVRQERALDPVGRQNPPFIPRSPVYPPDHCPEEREAEHYKETRGAQRLSERSYAASKATTTTVSSTSLDGVRVRL